MSLTLNINSVEVLEKFIGENKDVAVELSEYVADKYTELYFGQAIQKKVSELTNGMEKSVKQHLLSTAGYQSNTGFILSDEVRQAIKINFNNHVREFCREYINGKDFSLYVDDVVNEQLALKLKREVGRKLHDVVEAINKS